MTRQVEFFYDFRSPYSYLAFTRLLQMDVATVPKPMQILKVMERVGNVPTTITCAAKGRYARVDLGRWAQRYGVMLNPSDMKANDGDAMSRAVLAAATPEAAIEVTLALYRTIWSNGETLASTAAILAALDGAGIDTAVLTKGIDAPETIARLEANTDEAVERGVFGSPTIFVGDAMFFGNDRIEFVREELARLEKVA